MADNTIQSTKGLHLGVGVPVIFLVTGRGAGDGHGFGRDGGQHGSRLGGKQVVICIGAGNAIVAKGDSPKTHVLACKGSGTGGDAHIVARHQAIERRRTGDGGGITAVVFLAIRSQTSNSQRLLGNLYRSGAHSIALLTIVELNRILLQTRIRRCGVGNQTVGTFHGLTVQCCGDGFFVDRYDLTPGITIGGIWLHCHGIFTGSSLAVHCKHDVHHGDVDCAGLGAGVVSVGGEVIANGGGIALAQALQRSYDSLISLGITTIGVSRRAGDSLAVNSREGGLRKGAHADHGVLGLSRGIRKDAASCDGSAAALCRSLRQFVIALVSSIQSQVQCDGLSGTDVLVGIGSGGRRDADYLLSDLAVECHSTGDRSRTRGAVVYLGDGYAGNINICQCLCGDGSSGGNRGAVQRIVVFVGTAQGDVGDRYGLAGADILVLEGAGGRRDRQAITGHHAGKGRFAAIERSSGIAVVYLVRGSNAGHGDFSRCDCSRSRILAVLCNGIIIPVHAAQGDVGDRYGLVGADILVLEGAGGRRNRQFVLAHLAGNGRITAIKLSRVIAVVFLVLGRDARHGDRFGGDGNRGILH